MLICLFSFKTSKPTNFDPGYDLERLLMVDYTKVDYKSSELDTNL